MHEPRQCQVRDYSKSLRLSWIVRNAWTETMSSQRLFLGLNRQDLHPRFPRSKQSSSLWLRPKQHTYTRSHCLFTISAQERTRETLDREDERMNKWKNEILSIHHTWPQKKERRECFWNGLLTCIKHFICQNARVAAIATNLQTLLCETKIVGTARSAQGRRVWILHKRLVNTLLDRQVSTTHPANCWLWVWKLIRYSTGTEVFSFWPVVILEVKVFVSLSLFWGGLGEGEYRQRFSG